MWKLSFSMNYIVPELTRLNLKFGLYLITFELKDISLRFC